MIKNHWLSEYYETSTVVHRIASMTLACHHRQEMHPYWDVELLCSNLERLGFSGVLSNLDSSDLPNSSELKSALIDVSQILSSDFGDGGQFLSLWRDQCFHLDWGFPLLQSEGLLFDRKIPSLQRKWKHCRDVEGLDPLCIGLKVSFDGERLVDFSRTSAFLYDSASGANIEQWSPPTLFLAVASLKNNQMVVLLQDGSLYIWDLDIGIQTRLPLSDAIPFGIASCGEFFATLSSDKVAVFSANGDRIWSAAGNFTDDSLLVYSAETDHLMIYAGASLYCWRLRDGKLMSHLTQSNPDDDITPLLDFCHCIEGLLLFDSMGIWNKSRHHQLCSIEPLKVPIAFSSSSREALMIDGPSLQLWKLTDGKYHLKKEIPLQNAWGIDQGCFVSPNGELAVLIDGDSLVGVDFKRSRLTYLPLSPAFHATLGEMDSVCAVWVDMGDGIEVIRFNPD